MIRLIKYILFYTLTFSTFFIVYIAIMSFLFCLKCRLRRNQRTALQLHRPKPQIVQSSPKPNLYTVPENFELPLDSAYQSKIETNSRQEDVYAVPLHLVPASFDYRTNCVEHKGDYILVKNLKSIYLPDKEEYQTPSPYNPNYS